MACDSLVQYYLFWREIMNFINDFNYVDELIEKGLKNAVIDVDNTITKSNIVQFYLFVKKNRIRSRTVWYSLIVHCIAPAPFYMALDLLSRDLFNKIFVRNKFKKYGVSQLEQYAEQFFEEKLRNQFIVFTHDLIFHLKAQGI
jgi:hypothetical protein